MTEDEFAELKKRGETQVYASGCFKGLPEDKHSEERHIANLVIEHVGQSGASVQSEPHGPDTAPDVGIVLQSGECIGLEVTELVDGDLRGRHAKRRAVERTKGLSEKNVFESIIRTGRDPISNDYTIPPFGAYHAWEETEIAEQLDYLIRRKDSNIHLRANAGDYDELWVAVFTGEQHINECSDLVRKAEAHLTYRPTLISKVFVVLDYQPGRDDGSDYRVIEIRCSYI